MRHLPLDSGTPSVSLRPLRARPRRALAAILAGVALAACGPSVTASPGAPSGIASDARASDPTESVAGAASESPGASSDSSTSGPAATPFRCAERKGSIKDISYRSAVAGTTVRYRVYLPPCYESSGRRFPYVILTHGSDRDQTEWTDLLDADAVLEQGISTGKLPPMILVMPGGGDLANTRIFTPGKSYESVILDEIKPAVEKRFCTLGTRAGRAIGGISRGGFWAFLVAFRHPGMFAAIGGHSPFFHPDNAPAAYNPLDLAETVTFVANREPRIWVDAGAQDYAMPGIEPFVETLEARGIEHTFKLYATGSHELAYWKSHVSTYLAFYGRTWPRSYSSLPACGT